LATFSLRDFEGLIGARFAISLSGRSLGKVTLIAAAAADPGKPSHSPSRVLESFLLRFQGAGATLPQDTYLMEETSLGAFPLFLVPGGPGGSLRPTYLHEICRICFEYADRPVGMTRWQGKNHPPHLRA